MQGSRNGRITVLLALVVVVGLLLVMADRRGDTGATPAPTEAATAQTPTPDDAMSPEADEGDRPAPIVDTPPDSTLVATLPGDVPRHASPDAEPDGTVPGAWHGRPSILPVIDQEPGWLHVRLAQRPNGSTAWIRREGVELAATPYRIEIDVAMMRLRLYDRGELVVDAPAGIGKETAPTPLGSHFVTFLQEPPDTTSGWGPFVVVTSSHSETISDFEQSGDAITAIHGPLGAEEEIGDDGARVSFGCVRLHLEDLQELRKVPAGSPIDIIESSGERSSDA